MTPAELRQVVQAHGSFACLGCSEVLPAPLLVVAVAIDGTASPRCPWCASPAERANATADGPGDDHRRGLRAAIAAA